MTLQLSVDSAAWDRHVSQTASDLGDLIPVVKGNGYGFGRANLMAHAVKIANQIAVGTVFEAQDVPANCTALVLTPVGQHIPKDLPKNVVLTVGSLQHVQNLKNGSWSGDIVIKLRSSMNRYGADTSDVAAMQAAVQGAGLKQVGWSVHPPLDGTMQDHAKEVGEMIGKVASDLPWLISHVDASSLRELRAKFADKKIRVRSGTQLWLGDKSMLKLTADVLDTRAISAGSTAGYRNVKVASDGVLVMIGTGSSHGVHLVGAEQSPFHFKQKRLELLEPPHMHTSMVFVSAKENAPKVGDQVDVQQPLTRVYPDVTTWL